ncbi:hypothetical protein SASPL_151523 [Salvia splendens]|uniref:Uncharacterized protein n=1 Tax=Salvia splendens TaxID=180675 RepID=A0A8X8W7X7_SALSN|nr:hypothetical protein SASPL_151523 [Salvia splendens]
MKGGRKNLKRAVEEEMMALQHGQNIMQVVDLRGSNLIEGNIYSQYSPRSSRKACGSNEGTLWLSTKVGERRPSNPVEECSSDDDEGLPPLEANTNRVNPLLLHSDTETTSDDSDIEE